LNGGRRTVAAGGYRSLFRKGEAAAPPPLDSPLGADTRNLPEVEHTRGHCSIASNNNILKIKYFINFYEFITL